MKKTKIPEQEITLLDRFAIAFVSAVIAFITGLVVWLILAGANLGVITITVLSFKWVLGFTMIMAMLGFFMLENFLVNIYARIGSGICYMLGIDPGKL